MDSIRFRQLEKRDYRAPAPFLKRLREAEAKVLANVSDPKVRSLRTNRLKEWREARIAALFCHGMSERTGLNFLFSKGEFEDADFVAMWVAEDTKHFAPVQLKEVPPTGAGIEEILASLAKYSGASELTVVVQFNRRVTFSPKSVRIPSGLKLAGLWFIACIDPEQREWAIWGDFLEKPEGTRFAYPV